MCLLNDEGYRAIEGSSRPPLINLTVPPRDSLEDDLDAVSTDHPVGQPTCLTPQCLGRFIRRECFYGLLAHEPWIAG